MTDLCDSCHHYTTIDGTCVNRRCPSNRKPEGPRTSHVGNTPVNTDSPDAVLSAIAAEHHSLITSHASTWADTIFPVVKPPVEFAVDAALEGLQEYLITQADFDRLPEYSLSLPTGTEPGKRWRRNVWASAAHPNGVDGRVAWCIGEFGVAEGELIPCGTVYIPIMWYRPKIITTSGDPNGELRGPSRP